MKQFLKKEDEELLILSPKPSTILILYFLHTADSGTSEVALSPPFAKISGFNSSKDLQTVKTVVSVQYSITGAMAAKTFQKVGQKHQIQATVIEPAISESVKSNGIRRSSSIHRLFSTIRGFHQYLYQLQLTDKDPSQLLTPPRKSRKFYPVIL